MLKIVVFDGGYGGELFADKLEKELPVVDVIRVIDWRDAKKFLKSPRAARRACREALRPYIGRVDLIILANHLLTATSLKYFRRKYKNQKFLGLKLPQPDTFVKRPTIALTTKALAKTINYHNYIFRLRRKIETICLDDWPNLIDDGELHNVEIYAELERFRLKHAYRPAEIIIACSQFNDIIPVIRKSFRNIKIHDSFDAAIRDTCKTLKIRGGTGKKQK